MSRAATLARLLEAEYVFDDVAAVIGKALIDRVSQGDYDKVQGVAAYAEMLTAHIQQVHRDSHLVVVAAKPVTDGVPSRADRRRRLQRRNFGFTKVAMMDDAIGYLKIDSMTDTVNEGAGDAAVAAMRFVAGAQALIFDLRSNRGGSPTMVQLLMTYLLAGSPVHINSFYVRKTDELRQFWTLPYVPGRRFPDIPVYALTSRATFSGAEEFAYDLQAMGRGTLVGEKTAGGANPSTRHPIDAELNVMIPFGYPINPITGTNWEGVGVEPDVPCPADEALDVAITTIKQELTPSS